MSESAKNPKNVIFPVNDLAKLLIETEKKAVAPVALVAAIKGQCAASEPISSASALHVLTEMVQKGCLPLSKGISILISMLSSKEAIPSIVPAVCRLLISDASRPDWTSPYNLNDRPHPIVTILKHDWNYWSEISGFLHYLFDADPKLNPDRKIAIVWPIMNFVIADPLAPMLAKTEIFQLLMSHGEHQKLIELFAWQQVDFNWCTLVRLISQNKSSLDSLQPVLGPAFAVAILCLTTHGHDPSLWIFYLGKCAVEENSDLILNILVKVIPVCPTVYLLSIVKLCCDIIVGRKCNIWSASAIAASVLPWTISPSSLLPNLTSYLQKILTVLPNLPLTLNSSKQPIHPFVDSMPEARSAMNLLILSEKWTDDHQIVDSLTKLKWNFACYCKPLLLAVLLNSKSLKVAKLVLNHLKTICETEPGFCFPLWSVILYKLGKETDPYLQLYFLRMVPLMATDKGNMSLVLGTYTSLPTNDASTIPLRLNFLYSLFTVQSRIFVYLHRLLVEASLHKTWESQVGCASILWKICRYNPDPFGRQIVGLLSNIINNNEGDQGTEASALAVAAISELCKANVIDIQEAWKTLESKLGRENRPLVAKVVCVLLGECAEYQEENIRETAIARLWAFVDANCAANAALRALGRFKLDDFRFTTLPDRFRKNVVNSRLNVADSSKTPLDESLTYVPGDCWIQVLEKSPENQTEAVEELLYELLKKEVTELPRGIYALPLGVEEPPGLDKLTEQSLLKALVESLQRIIRNGYKKPRLTQSILKILGESYSRPLPPLNWSFLKPELSDSATLKLVVKILAQQGAKSASALKLLQEIVPKIVVDKEIIPTMCQVLPGMSQCLSVTILSAIVGDFLRVSLDDSFMFGTVLQAVRKSVAASEVPVANKTAVANALRELLVDLPQEMEDNDELWSCISEMPDSVIQRITSSSNWPEFTPRRVICAMRVCRASATKSDQPLEVFSDLIDIACHRTEDQFMFKQELVKVFHRIEPNHVVGAFRFLMTRLLAAVNTPTEASVISFLFDLLTLSAVVLSCHDLLLNPGELYTNSKLSVFPGCIQMFFDGICKEWMKNLPFTVESFYRLKKSNKLNFDETQAVHQALLTLKHHVYCLEPTRRSRLFS